MCVPKFICRMWYTWMDYMYVLLHSQCNSQILKNKNVKGIFELSRSMDS